MDEFNRLIILFNLHRERFHTLVRTKVVRNNELAQRSLDTSRVTAYNAMNTAARKLESQFPRELALYQQENPGWPYCDCPAPPIPAEKRSQPHVGPSRWNVGTIGTTVRIVK